MGQPDRLRLQGERRLSMAHPTARRGMYGDVARGRRTEGDPLGLGVVADADGAQCGESVQPRCPATVGHLLNTLTLHVEALLEKVNVLGIRGTLHHTGCAPFEKQQAPFFVSCGQE